MKSKRVTIREARSSDANELAGNMRDCDRAEVSAATTLAPLEAVQGAIAASSECWAAEADGTLLCVFGIAPYERDPDRAAPWFLATDAIARHGFVLAVKSREFVARLSAAYAVLDNVVYARNEPALQWLRWLGFTVEAPAPYGPYGEPFCRFHKMRGGKDV